MMTETKTYCARNYRNVPTHVCTGGNYCKGDCSPKMMNAIQEDYCRAKATYEILKESRDEQMKPYAHLLHRGATEQEITEHCDHMSEIETRLGLWIAHDRLIEAEQSLFMWAHRQVAKLPQYKGHEAEIEKLFATHLPSMREKLIDTCMRLRA